VGENQGRKEKKKKVSQNFPQKGNKKVGPQPVKEKDNPPWSKEFRPRGGKKTKIRFVWGTRHARARNRKNPRKGGEDKRAKHVS